MVMLTGSSSGMLGRVMCSGQGEGGGGVSAVMLMLHTFCVFESGMTWSQHIKLKHTTKAIVCPFYHYKYKRCYKYIQLKCQRQK